MTRYIQKSFTGGELSPALYARNDLLKSIEKLADNELKEFQKVSVKVLQLSEKQRQMTHKYTELLEMIARRSNSWKVDFNEIELLLQRLLRCFDENDPRSTDKKEASYTFRVCVGSRVLDIVRTERISKLKEYIGSYDKTSEVPLTVQFSIGDLSREEKHLSIGILVTLFDGRIDMADGSLFFNRLKDFLIQNHSFIMVS